MCLANAAVEFYSIHAAMNVFILVLAGSKDKTVGSGVERFFLRFFPTVGFFHVRHLNLLVYPQGDWY
jgi:hypothetical protein